MLRARAASTALALLVLGGCGGDAATRPVGPASDSGPEADVAAVRTVMSDYLRVSVARDWVAVCSLLTPQAAAQQVVNGTTDCAAGLAFQAMDGVPTVPPGAHPERANEDLITTTVAAVAVSGDYAQVALRYEGQRDPALISVCRESGGWKLVSIPAIAIPLDSGAG